LKYATKNGKDLRKIQRLKSFAVKATAFIDKVAQTSPNTTKRLVLSLSCPGAGGGRKKASTCLFVVEVQYYARLGKLSFQLSKGTRITHNIHYHVFSK
jgi:hypothetical protein